MHQVYLLSSTVWCTPSIHSILWRRGMQGEEYATSSTCCSHSCCTKAPPNPSDSDWRKADFLRLPGLCSQPAKSKVQLLPPTLWDATENPPYTLHQFFEFPHWSSLKESSKGWHSAKNLLPFPCSFFPVFANKSNRNFILLYKWKPWIFCLHHFLAQTMLSCLQYWLEATEGLTQQVYNLSQKWWRFYILTFQHVFSSHRASDLMMVGLQQGNTSVRKPILCTKNSGVVSVLTPLALCKEMAQSSVYSTACNPITYVNLL